MGRLIYVTPASLDGFIGDGDYSWSAPYAEEVKSVLTAGLAMSARTSTGGGRTKRWRCGRPIRR